MLQKSVFPNSLGSDRFLKTKAEAETQEQSQRDVQTTEETERSQLASNLGAERPFGLPVRCFSEKTLSFTFLVVRLEPQTPTSGNRLTPQEPWTQACSVREHWEPRRSPAQKLPSTPLLGAP